MPVMDEFREEREALKHGTPKQKFAYFLDYYKWHVIIAVAVIAFIVSMVYQSVTRKDTAFYAALVNVYPVYSDEHASCFAEYAQIDMDEYDIVLDSSMHIDRTSMDQETVTTTQKLMVYIAAREIDVIISDDATVEQYAYNESFFDIREILSQDQIREYEPYFYYMDQAVADSIHDAQNDPNYDYTQAPSYPDPRKPEDMEKPIPVGIYLDNATSFKEAFWFTKGDGVITVAATCPHPETAAKYIDFILQEEKVY